MIILSGVLFGRRTLFLQHLWLPALGSGVHTLDDELESPVVAEVEQKIDSHPFAKGKVADFHLVCNVFGLIYHRGVVDLNKMAEAILVAESVQMVRIKMKAQENCGR